ncbi:LysM peptidoglycan-binding domain-containing protein [Arthrobacter sp. U41]|uniref:LysM peptidoglycan-binding domain-containing protein n=1 Tax=Arthrobacter sp. U41 TaxID=1849032 RepID=UPI003FA43214
MVLNEYGLTGNSTTTRTPRSLIAAGPLLIACILAASLALQPPAGVTTTAAGQSLSAAESSSPEAAEPSPELPVAVQPVASEPSPAAAPEASAAGAVSEPPAAAPPEAGVGVDSNLYVVVAGDTVGDIASRLGVDVYAMLAANGLGVYSIILPGQTLKLSGPPVAVPAAPPAPALAPAAPAVSAPVAPAARTIFVAGSGGQAMVDKCIGPIHFTPTDAYALFITEHDFCGGWARFSGIGVGETVVISGYGTYTASGRGQVAQGATTNAVAAVFGGFPRAILQTCIPGTNQMLLIALN